ncbi:MAG: flagellar FliJ family protein [Anaerolineales bacterium]|nr:flagellar FliJ family protein [Anaerolineales bacterium]
MPLEFALQSVLDYRHSRVEALEIQLGRLLFEQQQALQVREALQAERRQLFETMREKQAGTLDLPALAHLRFNLKHLEQRLARQEALLVELARRIEEGRAQVVAAKQEEEALVILKNKELERYLAEERKHENSQRDDLYIMRAHQRRAE